MVGVGVGSGEWRELDPPRERDELDPVIFLIAPESFRPTPFMLATRANKNEREQLGSGYVSEIKMKFLPESCSSKYVINLAAKKWEREISWNQTWAKIQWKPEQECVRGSVSECVSMRELNTPLGLYLKERWRVHHGRGRPQRLWSRWIKWGPPNGHLGPADLWGRPAPWWARWVSPFSRHLFNGQIFWKCGSRPKFARKDVQIHFPKDFETQKNVFGIFV